MTTPVDDRLLLCRPVSGLNDTFCQIGKAYRYGVDFRRTVIVETDFASGHFFRDSFSNYFVSADPNLILDAGPYRDRFDELDVAPDHLFGRVNSYVARWVPSECRYLDADTGGSLAVDLSQDYAARLLVDHCNGSDGPPLVALSRMRLHPALVVMLGRRMRAIGGPYAGVHIRNTDLKTDYAPFIDHIRRSVDGPVFVATDDPAALEDARSAFGRDRVHSFADLAAGAGGPLHKTGQAENAYQRNADAIIDLLMLALAQRLYVMPILPNPYGGGYSGYSVLATRLKESPAVLHGLLRGPSPGAGEVAPA